MIIGTPFHMQIADDPHDAYDSQADSVSCQNTSGVFITSSLIH